MYPKKYFKECQLKITKDLKIAIENDTKIENIDYMLPPIFSQLVIWEKEDILENKRSEEHTSELQSHPVYDTIAYSGFGW